MLFGELGVGGKRGDRVGIGVISMGCVVLGGLGISVD